MVEVRWCFKLKGSSPAALDGLHWDHVEHLRGLGMEASVVFDEVAQHSQKEYGMANTIQNPSTDNKGWNQARPEHAMPRLTWERWWLEPQMRSVPWHMTPASNMADNADTLAANAGIEIQQFGEQMSKHSQTLAWWEMSRKRLARSVKEGGAYLEDEKLSGITKHALDIVVKNPIPSVCVAIGLGWLIEDGLVAEPLRNHARDSANANANDSVNDNSNDNGRSNQPERNGVGFLVQPAAMQAGSYEPLTRTKEIVMSQSTEAIRSQLDKARESLLNNYDSLGSHLSEAVQETGPSVQATADVVHHSVLAVSDALNIPRQIARHPWFALGAGVAVGFWISKSIGKPTPICQCVEDSNRSLQSPIPSPLPAQQLSRQPTSNSYLLQNLATQMLIRVAQDVTARIVPYLLEGRAKQ